MDDVYYSETEICEMSYEWILLKVMNIYVKITEMFPVLMPKEMGLWRF